MPAISATRTPNNLTAKICTWTLLIGTAGYSCYIVIRWISNNQLLPIPWDFVHHSRNVLLIFMGVMLSLGMFLGRKNANKDKKEQEGTVGGPPRRGKAWRVVQACLFACTPVVGVLNIIKFNGLSPFVDFGELSQSFLETTWISLSIELAMDITILLILSLFLLQLPREIDKQQSVVSRIHVKGRRIHESLLAFPWVIIGAGMILVGDEYDQLIAIFIIVAATFLIGKDYKDVKTMAFINDLKGRGGRIPADLDTRNGT